MEEKFLKVSDADDNVATALVNIDEGERVQITKDGQREWVRVDTEIPLGHKVATTPIYENDPVMKYGKVIGSATNDIDIGDWVHTHNLASNYDGEK